MNAPVPLGAILPEAAAIVNSYGTRVTLRELFSRLVIAATAPGTPRQHQDLAHRRVTSYRVDAPRLLANGFTVTPAPSQGFMVVMREVTLPIEARTEAQDFESFFHAEYRSLCQALLLLVGDAFEAEDIAQETMTRVLERWDRVGAMDSPAGYAYRTALNLQRKRIRRLAVRAKQRFASVPVDDIGPEAEERHDVRRALASLPDGQRAALILIDWLDMDTEEAGRALGIKPASVRVRLHRARSTLRDALGAKS